MNQAELAEKVARLPKWAQDHIQSLQRQLFNVTRDREAAHAAFNGGKTSDIFMETYGSGPGIYLPSNRVVIFETAEETFEVRFDRHWKTGEKIGIHVSTGMDAMAVYPEVANGVTIRKRGRD